MSNDYRMPRGWMHHPVFEGKKDPLCRRAAWIWMVEEAKYKDQETTIGMATDSLKRSQFSASNRFIANAWGWDEAKVRRFIKKLKDCGLIDAETDSGQTVVTIRNYDVFSPNGRKSDSPTDATSTQHRRSIDANLKEGKKEEKTLSLASSAATLPTVVGCADASIQDKVVSKTIDLFGNTITDEPSDSSDESGGEGRRTTLDMVQVRGYKAKAVWLAEQFDLFWAEFPKRVGSSSKDKAVGAFIKAVKASINPERIIYGAVCFRKNCIADGIAAEDGKRISRAVPMASSWLKLEDRNWEAAIEDYEDRLKNPVPVKPNNVTHVAFNNKPQVKRYAHQG